MSKHSTLIRALLVVAVGLGCACAVPRAAAQSGAVRERPKWKDFGESLERLKWDESKRAAVQAKAKKEEGRKAGEEVGEDEVVRVETSLVVCDVLVLDKQGRAVAGLTREDFQVAEDGEAQEVGTFALGDDMRVPRAIVLVIDYSGSQYPYIKMSVEAAKTLVERLGPRDRMALVTDDVELVADFTGDKGKLRKKLDSLAKRANDEGGFLTKALGVPRRRFGRSAQFSALLATLNEAFNAEDVRPVVIFQTDGDELLYLREPVVEPYVPPNLPPDMHEEALEYVRRSRRMIAERRREFGLRDVHAAAEKSRATIYTVVPGYRYVGLTFEEQLKKSAAARERQAAVWRPSAAMRERMEDRRRRTPPEAVRRAFEQLATVQQTLIDLAALTGGWADFLEEPEQAAAIYERIFSDVNRRYVIGYQPTNKARDGGRRRVSVEVRGHPEYTVWGRKFYYAPGPEE
ncbi:MAG TPA: VWA domain-containing protein [Pyrinomonadaceae bacterium]|nr:VWA domain-containing protein [Pyrinomonadaceae bacterium]